MNQATAVEKPVQKHTRMLPPQRMQLVESWRQDWVVNAEEGTTIEEVLDPAYFGLVCGQFQPYDRIEVRLESGEWILELVVIQRETTWADVRLLHTYDLGGQVEKPGDAQAPRHKVEWKGPQRKHCVIRIVDGAAVQEGFASKADAATWLSQYERTTAPRLQQ